MALIVISAQKMKFSIKDFLSKCDRRKLWIWSQLLKKSLMENFVFFVSIYCPSIFVYL